MGAFPRDFDSEEGARQYIRQLDTLRNTPGMEGIAESLTRYPAIYQRENGRSTNPNDFKSSHWGTPNVLAHVRMSDRDNGETLHVHEVQSDWGQEGRENGFYDPEKPFEVVNKKTKEVVSRHPDYSSMWDAYRTHPDSDNLTYGDVRDEKPPQGPYVGNTQQWTDLALKHILMEAAKGGYKRVVFSPGEANADLYGQRKEVSKLEFLKSNDSGEAGILSGFTPNGYYSSQHDVESHADLPKLIGKENAANLLAQPPTPSPDKGEDRYTHTLQGPLQVGGHGMVDYYKNYVNQGAMKLLQQHDQSAKPESYDLPEVYKGFALPVTDTSRESILKNGFQAFQRGGEVHKADGVEVDGDEDGITAYHGSPHSFDQFNIANLGTGEGAQAYGHGLYFAGNEEIAKHYRDTLAGGPLGSHIYNDINTYFGGYHPVASRSDVVDAIKSANMNNGDIQSALKSLADRKEMSEWQSDKEDAAGISQLAQDSSFTKAMSKKYGHMYKVKLNVKPHELLDWDKPLSEQPHVLSAIENRYGDPEIVMQQLGHDLNTATGRDFHDSMAGTMGDNRGAAQKLQDMGLKGIRYLDASSRAKAYNVKLSYKGKPFVDGQFEPQFAKSKAEADKIAREYQDKGYDTKIDETGTHNYVMFHHDPVKVVDKYEYGGFVPQPKYGNVGVSNGLYSKAADTVRKATGGQVMGYVPMATLPVSRLAVARAPQYQQQAPVARFSDSLNSLMDTVEGFKKKPDAPVDSPSAATEGHSPIGMIAMPESGYEATGMYAPFQSAIDQMIADAPGKITVTSGYRTPERQEELWNEHAAKYPDPEVRDNYVARPGQSSHNYGLAADLSYADEEALKWAQENAAKYGLNFRMGHEDWHIEPANIWELRNAMTVPGYSNGGSAMDDDNQNTGDNSNVESLSLARSLRNIGSGGGDDRVQGLFEKIAAGQQQAQKAYEMAHSNGEFDDFKIGDTFVYKHSKYPTPMKVTGFSVSRAEAFPQRKRIYNNHVPVLEMENQDAEKKVNKYPVEWFQENLHKYDFVSGKPRAVKAGGGAMDDSGQNGAMENGNAPINFETRPQAGGLLNAGGVRGSAGVLQAQDEAPLEGLPTKIGIPLSGQSVTAGPDPRIRQVARDYMASTGMKYNPPTKYAKVDPIRARRIAASYEGMKDDPNDPLTKASYDAMIKETMAQYNHAKKAGLKVEFWNPEKQEDPYGASPRLATEDVRKNHHMWVFPTYAGYGSGDPISEDDAKKNPLLQLTGETWNGIPVTVNDVFRAVHDYYGHAKEGVGFRADGEENAWRSHASMYSPLARMAMTSETRGQNSWLNYGPHGEKNRNARTEDTIFAPQKIGVMPHWAHHEGAEDFTLPEDVEAMQRIRSNFDPTVSKALALTRRFTKGGESAINALKSKGK